MKTKLTLHIDQRVIDNAKAYAQANGKSVSRLVSDYFAALGTDGDRPLTQLTPLVDSLLGVLKKVPHERHDIMKRSAER